MNSPPAAPAPHRIESYRFGRMVIDGVAYEQDLIVLRDRVLAPWWRTAGSHVFAPQDLTEVIAARPRIVLLGRGYFSLVVVQEAAVEALEAVGSQVVAGCTAAMVGHYNRLAAEGRDVAACLHLTC